MATQVKASKKKYTFVEAKKTRQKRFFLNKWFLCRFLQTHALSCSACALEVSKENPEGCKRRRKKWRLRTVVQLSQEYHRTAPPGNIANWSGRGQMLYMTQQNPSSCRMQMEYLKSWAFISGRMHAFFFNPYCWLFRWLSLAFWKLNDSMRPVQPVWYCRHPGSRGLKWIRWWIGWEKAFNLSSHPPSLPHSSCVTLMSHMRWAALAALNAKLKVAVSPALAPMSTYTASCVFSKYRQIGDSGLEKPNA